MSGAAPWCPPRRLHPPPRARGRARVPRPPIPAAAHGSRGRRVRSAVWTACPARPPIPDPAPLLLPAPHGLATRRSVRAGEAGVMRRPAWARRPCSWRAPASCPPRAVRVIARVRSHPAPALPARRVPALHCAHHAEYRSTCTPCLSQSHLCAGQCFSRAQNPEIFSAAYRAHKVLEQI